MLKPVLQVHWKLPLLLLHTELPGHLLGSSEHSSTSGDSNSESYDTYESCTSMTTCACMCHVVEFLLCGNLITPCTGTLL